MFSIKKVFLSWFLTLALLVTLCACDSDDAPETETDGSAVPDSVVSDSASSKESSPTESDTSEESRETPSDSVSDMETESVPEVGVSSDAVVPEEETTSPVVELPKVEFD